MRTARHNAFTMVEVMTVLVMVGLIFVALFMIFDNARRVSANITQKLENSNLAAEIFQRISEDLDRLTGPGSNATLEIQNSFASGFPSARITITSQVTDKDNKPQVLEEVIWQTTFDLATKRLLLWRCHSGISWEDKLLDAAERADWTPNRHVFVPLCSGLSFFKIQVPQLGPQATQPGQTPPPANNQPINRRARTPQEIQQQLQQKLDQQDQQQEIQYADSWSSNSPPPAAVAVTLSFADPVETRGGSGGKDVLDTDKIFRTIVLNRTKKIAFNYVPPPDANSADANSTKDANSASSKKNRKASDSNSPGGRLTP